MQITTIGLDIAKNVFQVHGIDAEEKVAVRKQLRRDKVMAFFKALPPCLIGMEACAMAHYWARKLSVLAGHWRYAHMTTLPCDPVNPPLLGMTEVVSEDAVRRVSLEGHRTGPNQAGTHPELCHGPAASVMQSRASSNPFCHPFPHHQAFTPENLCTASIVMTLRSDFHVKT